MIEFACQYSSDLAALTVSLVADSSDFVASWDKWSFVANLLYSLQSSLAPFELVLAQEVEA